MIENTHSLIRFLVENYLENIDTAIDMTCGNGNDSLMILNELKPKKLYSFDIQEQAKINTMKLLGLDTYKNFEFILDSHANFDKYVKEEVDFAIYNLGYLPKADHSITTKADQVLASIKKLLDKLSSHGLVLITFYPGHEEGLNEAKLICDYLHELDQKKYTVLKFDFINQKNSPPFSILFQRR